MVRKPIIQLSVCTAEFHRLCKAKLRFIQLSLTYRSDTHTQPDGIEDFTSPREKKAQCNFNMYSFEVFFGKTFPVK